MQFMVKTWTMAACLRLPMLARFRSLTTVLRNRKAPHSTSLSFLLTSAAMFSECLRTLALVTKNSEVMTIKMTMERV